MVTDDNGDVVSRFEHGAFGDQLASSFDGVPGGMPYGWIGGLGVRYDSDIQLHYMRQRWYDPTLQRFISRDPIGVMGSLNLYAYCSNSPVNRVDPSGLQDNGAFMDAVNRVRQDLRNALSPGGSMSNDAALRNQSRVGPQFNVTPEDYLKALDTNKPGYDPNGRGATTFPDFTSDGKMTGTTTNFSDRAKAAYELGGDTELKNIIIHELLHSILLREMFTDLRAEAGKCGDYTICFRRVQARIKQYWLKIHSHRWFDPLDKTYHVINIPIDWSTELPKGTVDYLAQIICRGVHNE